MLTPASGMRATTRPAARLAVAAGRALRGRPPTEGAWSPDPSPQRGTINGWLAFSLDRSHAPGSHTARACPTMQARSQGNISSARATSASGLSELRR